MKIERLTSGHWRAVMYGLENAYRRPETEKQLEELKTKLDDLYLLLLGMRDKK